MNEKIILSPETRIRFKGTEIEGHIIYAMIWKADVQYSVAYWNNGVRNVTDVHEFEIEPCGDYEYTKIGFRSHK